MNRNPVILFGGKGGVGKTTCSAAVAVQASSSGKRTIIITSDMTPSLTDVFEVEIGDTVKQIHENLDALEISQEAITKRWKEKFGNDFYEILSHLIDVDGLDSESRHQLLDYIGSAPSLREETMLDLIVDLAEGGRYEQIIWDTAPSGETLNLINMPRIIRKHLKAGARVFEGLDKIGKQIVGKRPISGIMDEWIIASERISAFIHGKATFVIVANPEALVVHHVRRLLKALGDYQIDIHGMVINRVVELSGSASLLPFRKMQEKHIEDLTRLGEGLSIARVPLSVETIRGFKPLKETGELLVKELRL